MIFNPVHYIPAGRKDDITAHEIDGLFAIAHKQEGGTNHWCLSLCVSDSLSVMVNCQPSYNVPSTVLTGGSKANVIISEMQDDNPGDIERVFSHALRPGTTVGAVVGCLIDNGRHKYEFDSTGVGCRYWMSDVLDLLLEKQLLIDKSAVAETKSALVKLWPEKTPLPLAKGAYYA